MKALVTGGAGFIGSHVVDSLLTDGHDVVVLDDLSTGRSENVAAGADLVTGDLADESVVMRAVADCEVVFHLGARGSVPRSIAEPLETDRANVRGTLSVLEAAHRAGVRRVVLSSSSSVYGGATVVPTDEDQPLVPRSPYAVSKLVGEHYARVFTELHGLETVCLRYFNVFGPRQRVDSQYAAVVPRFIDAVRHERAVEVHGDGRQSRDFTFVADAVAGNRLAAEAPAPSCSGRAFNIARGETHTVLALLDEIARLAGTPADIRHTVARAGDVRRSRASIAAARRDLGFDPSTTFADGLAATFDWWVSMAPTAAVPA